jgi:hypothetical protein
MSDEKKVDEDWKRRAQQEREQDSIKVGDKTPEPEPAAPGAKAGPPPKKPSRPSKPGADFLSLVESLASQALMFMGAVRDPMTGQTHQDLGQAQAMIDLLEMLEDKTQGNLSKEEGEALRQILDEIRMHYVRLSSPPPPPGPRGPMMGNRGPRPM